MIPLNPRVQAVLRWVAYGLGYVALLIFFAYLSFPYERLRQYVISTYNAAQTGAYPNRLEVDSVGWSWRFPGVQADGVRLVMGTPPPDPDQRKPPPEYLEAEHVYASISTLALLSGAREVSFGAKALGGEISGWARDTDDLRKLEIELDHVNPGQVPQLAAAVGLPLSGVSSGLISLDLPQGNVLKADGVVDVQIDDLVVGDGKAKIQNTIALPELHMGSFRLKAQIAAGRLKIDECTAHGRDVDLTLTGGLKLRRRIENSIADMDLEFRFSDKYKTQSDLTKALFGPPDSKVPGLFDTATRGVLSKLEDGGYGSRLSGAFSRLRPRPKSGRSSKAGGAAARRRNATRRKRPASTRRSRRKAGKATGDIAPPKEPDEKAADEDEEDGAE